MKNNLIILVLVFLLNSCVNKPEKDSIYFTGSFNDAIELAKSENKGVFLDFYTVWCGSCKSYDRFVFSDSLVQKYLLNNFIFLSVDAEKGQGLKLREKFEINAYPTLIVANNEGIEIGRLTGYKLEYGENGKTFIDKIEEIKKGIGTLNQLIRNYETQPGNYNLMNDLISKYEEYGKYEEIEKIATKMMCLPENDQKIKGKFYYAYSWIKRRDNANPQAMKELINSGEIINTKHIVSSYYALLNYYSRQNKIDSTEYFYEKVIGSSTNNWYEQKKYAKFLFENNRKIETASKIARDYPIVEDHYKPMLMAYAYANDGNIEKGISNFEDWMNTYANKYPIEDSYWSYYYFAETANKYNTHLDKALLYIQKAENHRGNLDDKLLLAEILYKLDKKEQAIITLNSALKIVNSEKSYIKINNLISQYKK